MNFSADDIEVLPELEAIRRRPAFFLGPGGNTESSASHLLRSAVRGLTMDEEAPSAVRVTVWRDGLFTVAFDGVPLPLEPAPDDRFGHPALYRIFMNTLCRAGRWPHVGILNALSEFLEVFTTHEGVRYSCQFARGGLVSLLAEDQFAEVSGSVWVTSKPDASLITGTLTTASANEMLDRIAEESPHIRFSTIDRTNEKCRFR